MLEASSLGVSVTSTKSFNQFETTFIGYPARLAAARHTNAWRTSFARAHLLDAREIVRLVRPSSGRNSHGLPAEHTSRCVAALRARPNPGAAHWAGCDAGIVPRG